MALPHVFANVSELDTPALDDNFNALGALVVIPCTAAGSNTIALTPAANSPTISAYTSRSPIFGFVASGTTSTSPVTANISGVGAKSIYKANGAALIGSNDFVTGSIYYIAYDSTLNSGAGGFVVINPGSTAAAAGSIQGNFKNLFISNTSVANAQTHIQITADAVSVSDGATSFNSLLTVSLNINSATSGANGIDTGSIANTTWYAVYVIFNPSTLTTAGLISTSFSSPSLPSGYTQFARVGSARTDGSAHFINFMQRGRRVSYLVGTFNGSSLAASQSMAAGASGSVTVPTWTAVAVGAYVPTTAAAIDVGLTAENGATSGAAMAAPNNNYGAMGSVTNPPALSVFATGAQTNVVGRTLMVLETTNIYYACVTAGALFCFGYEDNL